MRHPLILEIRLLSDAEAVLGWERSAPPGACLISGRVRRQVSCYSVQQALEIGNRPWVTHIIIRNEHVVVYAAKSYACTYIHIDRVAQSDQFRTLASIC
jgi:hypothetical protein